MSRLTDLATTGVVAVVRPEHGNEGAFGPLGATFEPTFDRKRTFDLDAVITQDPYDPASGEQFWSHPPV